MNDKPRAYTEDEVVDMIARHAKTMARYWANIPEVDKATGKKYTVEDRCDGVAWSILAMFDGCSMGIPAFDLKAAVDPSDKKFHKEQGENWFDPKMVISTNLRYRYSKEE